jgi:general secretion pathway protein F
VAHFRYKAVSATGETLEGDMEAADQGAVVRRLQSAGHLPVSVDAAAAAGSGSLLGRDLFARRRANRRDLHMLTRELATLIDAGLPLDRSLEILIDLSDEQVVSELLESVLEGISGGASLADAMAAQSGVFPRYYLSMIQAGEAGGTLDVVLARLTEFMERSQAMRESVRSALIYPVILVAMSVLAVVILLSVVVPRFRPLFEDAGQALPVSTRIVVGLGDAFAAYWWLMLAVVVGAGLLLRWQLARPAFRLRWDRMMLALPLLGDVIVRAEVARFTRTLGTMIGNGVSLLTALQLATNTVGNASLAHELDEVSDAVRQGKPLTEPLLRSGQFPRLATHLTRVGEETGRLEDMLLKVAEIYDLEVSRAIERMLALLVPLLTITLGMVIAGIIGSILVAILSVYDLPY